MTPFDRFDAAVEFASPGSSPCLVLGAFNAVEKTIGQVEALGRFKLHRLLQQVGFQRLRHGRSLSQSSDAGTAFGPSGSVFRLWLRSRELAQKAALRENTFESGGRFTTERPVRCSHHVPTPDARVHHIGLSVSKLEESAAFFTSVLGWKEVRRNDYPAIFVSDDTIMITLWQTKEAPAAPFDRKRNVGLHHVALRVESEAALTEVHEVLVSKGVAIEFAPEAIGVGPAKHTICYEPSGVRVEFIWGGQ